jgi:hypothetical protein
MKHTKSPKKGKAKTAKKSKLSSRKQKPSKRGNTYQLTRSRRRSKQLAKTSIRFGKRKHIRKKSGSIVVKPATKNKIVRIMGHGQYSVDSKVLQRLNEIDDLLVQLVNTDRPDDNEFKKHLIELTTIVEKNGKPLDSKEIIQSDIILPSADLSIDEAKRLFIGEGVVPEILP